MIRIAVGHADHPKQMAEAVIDTGFTGFLSLSSATIASLNLPWTFHDVETLGDGSEVIFEKQKSKSIWSMAFG